MPHSYAKLLPLIPKPHAANNQKACSMVQNYKYIYEVGRSLIETLNRALALWMVGTTIYLQGFHFLHHLRPGRCQSAGFLEGRPYA